jgi:hypothetical protein
MENSTLKKGLIFCTYLLDTTIQIIYNTDYNKRGDIMINFYKYHTGTLDKQDIYRHPLSTMRYIT